MRPNAKPFCFRATHDERVGVVEAEVRGHADVEFRERFSHFVLRKRLLRLQNFFANGAGVFRINIDLCTAQRLPENDRAAHPGSLLNREPGALEDCFRDSAQDVGFGKFLRADDDGFRRVYRRCREQHGQAEECARLQNAALL